MRKRLAVLCAVLFVLAACKKKFGDYYDRPGNLEPPIYQQLQARGNFTHILAAIDRAGYTATLSAAGYWTFFAPHDSAFNVYLKEKNISSVQELDSVTCRNLVTYCLVYNAFRKDRLDDYQSTTGWIPSTAFKRRTANYTFVYDGIVNGQPAKLIASNRNGITFNDADNNNKYIPYFVDEYMQQANLSAADYNYFYPNTPYTGFNVVDAVVTEQDIPAENGVIHVVNKVITALPSIDQYLEDKPQYSLFKSLFDKFLVQYVLNQGITHRYQVTRGVTDQVYTKTYSAPFGTLAYSLNNENYLTPDNQGQTESYSIFVPTNDVLQAYIDNVLLQNYPPGTTLEDVPVNIVYDFVNAHLWQKAVWPSKFGSTTNYLGEEARFDANTDIVEKKILSNGIFYGATRVQEANVFTSVYGRAYLDPNYSMMAKLLDFELKSVVSDIGREFTLFMISDTMFRAAGFTHDASVSNNTYEQYRFTPPAGSTVPASTGATTRNRMLRILNMHIVPRRLDNLPANAPLLTLGGEYIGIKNNQLFGSGNVDAGESSAVGISKSSRNGRVYYIDKMLDVSDNPVGAHIEKLGTTPDEASSPYNYFWQLLKGSEAWNAATKEIRGVANAAFYTLFIPTNTAIMQAVKDGYLPGDVNTGEPRFLASAQSPAERLQTERFIQYHFIDRRTVAADGIEIGALPTLLKTNIGDPVTVTVYNNPGAIEIVDRNNRTSHVISDPTHYIGNRIMIHLIDNYLQYTL